MKVNNKTWFIWGLTTAIGVWMLLSSLGGPHLCSPVIGCGVEAPLALTIIISAILLVVRVFKKNKLKLITPLLLLVFCTPSLIFYLVNTV
jgi:hypothetical protein